MTLSDSDKLTIEAVERRLAELTAQIAANQAAIEQAEKRQRTPAATRTRTRGEKPAHTHTHTTRDGAHTVRHTTKTFIPDKSLATAKYIHYDTHSPNVVVTPVAAHTHDPQYVDLQNPNRKVFCAVHHVTHALSECVYIDMGPRGLHFVCRSWANNNGFVEYIPFDKNGKPVNPDERRKIQSAHNPYNDETEFSI